MTAQVVLAPSGSLYPPFGTPGVADPATALDVGISNGNGAPIAWSALAGQFGFALTGAVNSDAAVNGFLPNNGANFFTSTTQLPNAPAQQGTIYCQVSRIFTACDARSFITAGNNIYFNSFGENTQTPASAGPFSFGSVAANSLACNCFQSGTGSIAGSITGQFQASSVTATIQQHSNSNVGAWLDPQYCELVISWKNGQLFVFLDWLLIYSANIANSPLNTLFNRMILGCSAPGGAQSLYGGQYLKRLQISTKVFVPQMLGPKVAFFGDSYIRRGDNSNEPAADTVAGINAVQLGQSVLQGINNASFGITPSQFGNSNFIFQLQQLSMVNYGSYFPWYNAGRNGDGFAHNLTSGVNANEFPTAYGDAIIQFSPEVLVCMGSVNDVLASPNYCLTLGADVLQKLQYIVAGKSGGANWAAGVTQYPKRLRAILFYEFFSCQNIPVTPFNTVYYAQQVIANTNSVNSAINGISIGGVPVTFIPVAPFWTQNKNYNFFNVGSDPQNTITTGGDAGPNGAAPNIHPGAVGQIQQANIMWPTFGAAIAPRPVRSLY